MAVAILPSEACFLSLNLSTPSVGWKGTIERQVLLEEGFVLDVRHDLNIFRSLH